jgi:hypothetical protein
MSRGGGGGMGMGGGGRASFNTSPQFFSAATDAYGDAFGDGINEGDLSVSAQSIVPLASIDDPDYDALYGDSFGRGGGGGGGGHGGGGHGGHGHGGFGRGRNFPFFGGPWGGGWGWGWGLPYDDYFDEPDILYADPYYGAPVVVSSRHRGMLG